MKDLKQILLEKNVKFKNGKIYLPDNIKHIKLDIGLSFDAPHSQNWIDNVGKALKTESAKKIWQESINTSFTDRRHKAGLQDLRNV